MTANLHYWDLRTSASINVATIAAKGTTYGLEDIVWHAWGSICQLYFPSVASDTDTAVYTIDREAYRGPPGDPSAQRPDVAVKRIYNRDISRQRPIQRDCLWIECKAPNHDKPSGWHELLDEAIDRLEVAHPRRMVFLILACGLKWMIFKWDPNRPRVTDDTLQMYKFNRQHGLSTWKIDRRIKLPDWIPPENAFYETLRWPYLKPNGSRRVAIDTSSACSLDYWSIQNGQIANQDSIDFLHQCFEEIQRTNFPGQNDAHF